MTSQMESLKRELWVPLDLAESDQTTDIAAGPGGNAVYISGYKQGETDADGRPKFEALLMAYNSSGVRQWIAQYGSSGYDFGNSVAADSTGVYLAGTLTIPHNGTDDADEDDDTDAFLVKYNSTGGVVWEKAWGTSEPDLGNGVAVDGGSGLVYVVGTTRGAMDTTNALLSSSGGGSGTRSDENTVDEEIAGVVNAGASDVFLSCLSASDGERKWTVQFGSSVADVGNRVAVGPRGSVYLVGQLGDDGDDSLAGARAFLAKYDYLGNSQVSRESVSASLVETDGN